MKDKTNPQKGSHWIIKVVLFLLLTMIPATCFYSEFVLSNQIPEKPLAGGWPVAIYIDADSGDALLATTNSSLDDKADAPEIVVTTKLPNGTIRELVGPNYRPLMITQQLARDFRGHPCDETFSCVVRGEIVSTKEIDIVVNELEKALIGAKLRPLGSTRCRLNQECEIEGVKVRFQTE